jgi:single-stranded-DNA-specific exonuclease
VESTSIYLYTDGACKHNPGPGGWCWVLVNTPTPNANKLAHQSGGEALTTNNRMELLAIISGLRYIKGFIESKNSVVPIFLSDNLLQTVVVYTDSKYVTQAFTDKWLQGWQKNGWRNSKKEEVKNKDLWLDLLHAIQELQHIGIQTQWQWVKGHSGDTWNDFCDVEAVKMSNQNNQNNQKPVQTINFIDLDQYLAPQTYLPRIQGLFYDTKPHALKIPNPNAMKDFVVGIDRVCLAISNQEKIAVFADYDVDGTCSAALFHRFFTHIQYTNFVVYFPHRKTEGYGLNPIGVEKLHKQGVTLIITVDNGIAAVSGCQTAHTLGIDVVITDHHSPQETLPKALAIINPKQIDCPYVYKDLAAVGVAWLFINALQKALHTDWDVYHYGLDLVAIATVADMVPLINLNHRLVHSGLKIINQYIDAEHRRYYGGLYQLLQLSKNTTRLSAIDSQDIGFKIAPLLNAAGRLEHASQAFSLLVETDASLSQQLAHSLFDTNQKRKDEVTRIMAEYTKHIVVDTPYLTVVLGRDFHIGVVGIAASRILDDYQTQGKAKGVLVLTYTGNDIHDPNNDPNNDSNNGGVIKGSGRSPKNIPLFSVMEQSKHLYSHFGGHSCALGLTMQASNIDALLFYLKQYVSLDAHTDQGMALNTQVNAGTVPVINITIPQWNTYRWNNLRLLEPFGQEHPNFVFVLHHVYIHKIEALGKDIPAKHCKIYVKTIHANITAQDHGDSVEAMHPIIAFGSYANWKALEYTTVAQIQFKIRIDFWGFKEKIECMLV